MEKRYSVNVDQIDLMNNEYKEMGARRGGKPSKKVSEYQSRKHTIMLSSASVPPSSIEIGPSDTPIIHQGSQERRNNMFNLSIDQRPADNDDGLFETPKNQRMRQQRQRMIVDRV